MNFIATRLFSDKTETEKTLVTIWFLCSFVVTQILSGENRETIVDNIHSKLQEVGQKVKDGEIPVDLYLITKVTCTLPLATSHSGWFCLSS